MALLALTLLNVLNFADRYLIISFSTAIIPELGLTHLQFGLLTGFVFTALGYLASVQNLIASSDPFETPRTQQWNLGVQRQLPRPTTGWRIAPSSRVAIPAALEGSVASTPMAKCSPKAVTVNNSSI